VALGVMVSAGQGTNLMLILGESLWVSSSTLSGLVSPHYMAADRVSRLGVRMPETVPFSVVKLGPDSVAIHTAEAKRTLSVLAPTVRANRTRGGLKWQTLMLVPLQ